MRRRMQTGASARTRAFVYVSALVAMAVYAIPQLPKLQPGLPGTFSMLWILFLALAVAANVYFMVGADVERRRMLEEQAVVGNPAAKETVKGNGFRRSLGR